MNEDFLQSIAGHIAALTQAAMPCSVGSTGACNLTGVLHLLYAVAGMLGVILVVVIALAVHAWRKTKEVELTKR